MTERSLIDTNLARIVIEAHRHGFSVQSDFARRNADYVGMASSMGLVSTRIVGNAFGRMWRPTVDGLTFLQAIEVSLVDDEEEYMDA